MTLVCCDIIREEMKIRKLAIGGHNSNVESNRCEKKGDMIRSFSLLCNAKKTKETSFSKRHLLHP